MKQPICHILNSIFILLDFTKPRSSIVELACPHGRPAFPPVASQNSNLGMKLFYSIQSFALASNSSFKLQIQTSFTLIKNKLLNGNDKMPVNSIIYIDFTNISLLFISPLVNSNLNSIKISKA